MLAQAERWLPLDYYGRLEEIAALFGRESIDVRVYDRNCFEGGDVRRDFLSALELSRALGVGPEVEECNPSLRGNALEIKRMLNARPDIAPEALDEARRIAAACSRLEPDSYSMFSPGELAAFLARYEESNRRVARDYLGADAPLFDPPGELPPKWEADNPRMRETFLRFLKIALDRSAAPSAAGSRFRRRLHRWKRALRAWTGEMVGIK